MSAAEAEEGGDAVSAVDKMLDALFKRVAAVRRHLQERSTLGKAAPVTFEYASFLAWTLNFSLNPKIQA